MRGPKWSKLGQNGPKKMLQAGHAVLGAQDRQQVVFERPRQVFGEVGVRALAGHGRRGGEALQMRTQGGAASEGSARAGRHDHGGRARMHGSRGKVDATATCSRCAQKSRRGARASLCAQQQDDARPLPPPPQKVPRTRAGPSKRGRAASEAVQGSARLWDIHGCIHGSRGEGDNRTTWQICRIYQARALAGGRPAHQDGDHGQAAVLDLLDLQAPAAWGGGGGEGGGAGCGVLMGDGGHRLHDTTRHEALGRNDG